MNDRWTNERVALLGFLVGLGWDSCQISKHPSINTTPNNVHRQVQRCGLSFRNACRLNKEDLKVQENIWAFYASAAKDHGVSPESVILGLLIICAKNPTIFDNVM